MLTERQQRIDLYIQEKGEIKLNDLTSVFTEVSRVTLRRDLQALERHGKLLLVRGGAKSINTISLFKEAAYNQRITKNVTGKKIIAEKALSLLSPNRSIFIDSGSTCMYLAQSFPDEKLIVLTSAPNISLELLRHSNVRVSLTGGLINRDTFSMTDMHAVTHVNAINIDIAFIATSAFTLKNGFSCGDFGEMEFKRLVIQKAAQVVMLMDKTKLDMNLPYTFAQLSDIDILVTDEDLPEKYDVEIRNSNVKLI